MNLILSVGSWFQENWMIIVLIVLAILLLVPTYLKQKKEAAARSELSSSIKKGVKIITTAGVYGVVESVEDTTDGKVVTIVTGNSKNPSTMTIHINAIMGIDNKQVEESKNGTQKESTKEVDEDVDSTEEGLEEKPVKKSSSKSAKASK